MIYYETESGVLFQGHVLDLLRDIPDNTVQCCVTSPPYWGHRDYDHPDQIGQESTPQEYVDKLVEVFREVRRVLRDDGILWLNLGDSYNGSGGDHEDHHKRNKPYIQREHGSVAKKNIEGLKPKDLVGIPWMAAFALRDDGWYLRQDNIWSKPNPMRGSYKDRCTTAHEYMFLLAKSRYYHYDIDAIRTRNDANKLSVWTVNTQGIAGAHFAVFPPKLVTPCVLAGSAEDDVVLDPFMGSGTIGMLCEKHGRRWIGFELNPKYCEMIKERVEPLAHSKRVFNSFFK